MEYIIPEGLKAYMDAYHGQFSRKLAEWAISKMKTKRNTYTLAFIFGIFNKIIGHIINYKEYAHSPNCSHD